jgi:hypothetical protein
MVNDTVEPRETIVLLQVLDNHYLFFKYQQYKSERNEMKLCLIGQEEFEDTKGTIRIRISKKNRQHNDQ